MPSPTKIIYLDLALLAASRLPSDTAPSLASILFQARPQFTRGAQNRLLPEYSNLGAAQQTVMIRCMQLSDVDDRPKGAASVVVDENSAGQRIDNFLMARLKGVPKSRIYKSLRRGEVRINRGRIRQSYRLQLGDVVRVPPLRSTPVKAKQRVPASMLAAVKTAIIFEDDELLVLNKPAGIAVHAGSSHRHGVIEALKVLRPEVPGLALVHRIDRDTSGCLLIAKTRKQLTALHSLIRNRALQKFYLTLVAGYWVGGEQQVGVALRRNRVQSGERMVRPDSAGKSALSHFRPLDSTSMASLVEVQIFTGRTHQIRVHAASVHHPVAGDSKYGDKTFNRACRVNGLKRMFLHAHRLEFRDPQSARSRSFVCPLPAELQMTLDRFGLKA